MTKEETEQEQQNIPEDVVKFLPKTIIPTKIWRLFSGEWCPECDAILLIHTTPLLPDGWGFDDDPIRCPCCSFKGMFKIIADNECKVIPIKKENKTDD